MSSYEDAVPASESSQDATQEIPRQTAVPKEVAFRDMPLLGSIHEAIEACGWDKPSPVQAACIPHALEGKDVIGLAQTGTGKTGAFAIPIIQKLTNRLELGALVLAPTRELAMQITVMFNQLGASSGCRVATIVGGVPIEKDNKALHSWPNVLVATPGRLIDHLEQGTVNLSEIEVFAVDEADRMHDMGFMPQIRRILEALPAKRQTLMFTATLPPDVERVVRHSMRDPVHVQVGTRCAPAHGARQELIQVDEESKTRVLTGLLRKSEGRVLVFVRTKRSASRLGLVLAARDFPAARLHGDMEQCDRDEAMNGFRTGRYRILVATDIAARGLDVADIEHVINYDFPQHPEDYVHRIGRTARQAAVGVATSFVTRADSRYVLMVRRLIGDKLPAPMTPDGQQVTDHAVHSHAAEAGHSREGGNRRRPRGRSGNTKTGEPQAQHAKTAGEGESAAPRKRRRRGGRGRKPQTQGTVTQTA